MPLNKDNEKLTEKIQILLTPSDLRSLYMLITEDAIAKQQKPQGVSSFVRMLIKDAVDRRSEEK